MDLGSIATVIGSAIGAAGAMWNRFSASIKVMRAEVTKYWKETIQPQLNTIQATGTANQNALFDLKKGMEKVQSDQTLVLTRMTEINDRVQRLADQVDSLKLRMASRPWAKDKTVIPGDDPDSLPEIELEDDPKPKPKK